MCGATNEIQSQTSFVPALHMLCPGALGRHLSEGIHAVAMSSFTVIE